MAVLCKATIEIKQQISNIIALFLQGGPFSFKASIHRDSGRLNVPPGQLTPIKRVASIVPLLTRACRAP